MAIHPKLDGLTAEIICEGQALPEIDDADDEATQPNTIVKYIEAKSSAFFEVKMVVKPNSPLAQNEGIAMNIYVDGVVCRWGIMSPESLRSGRPDYTQGVINKGKDGISRLQKFKFSDVQLGKLHFHWIVSRSKVDLRWWWYRYLGRAD